MLPGVKSSIEQRAQRVVEEFATLTDPIDRYQRLVGLGDAMRPFPAEARTAENQLPGCQYAVWVLARYDAARGILRFQADSDARIIRGLAALILEVVDGLSPAEVLEADLGFLDTIGLRTQLSVHRSNGFAALVDAVRARAREHMADETGTTDRHDLHQ
jgi:cysteine desulfuration protein SufE